jgi:hypothetical protein
MYDPIGQQRVANRPVRVQDGAREQTRATNPRRQVRTVAGGLEQVRPLKVHTNRDCNPTGWAFQGCAKQGKKGTVGRAPATLPYRLDLSE